MMDMHRDKVVGALTEFYREVGVERDVMRDYEELKREGLIVSTPSGIRVEMLRTQNNIDVSINGSDNYELEKVGSAFEKSVMPYIKLMIEEYLVI